MSRIRKPGATLSALVALLVTTLAGCTVGPSQRPELVVRQQPVDAPAGSSTAPPSNPVGPGGPGQQAAPAEWEACDPSYRPTDPATGQSFDLACTTLRVPRDYRSEGLGTFPLTVARARTAGLPDNAPALVVVWGDPGENGSLAVASVAAKLPTAITDHFAVVVPDLRGTATSAGVSCVDRRTLTDLLAPAVDPGSDSGAAIVARTSRSLSLACTGDVGPDLSRFATVPAADDLDFLRSALGTDKLTFLGSGYGATLGTVYVDRYPGRVAAAVLDSPTDPLQPADKAAGDRAAAAEQALDEFAAACATFDGGCPLGTDPRRAVQDLVKTLGEDGRSGSGQVVNGGTALLALRAGLGHPDDWPALATALAGARDGDTDALVDLVRTSAGGDDRRQLLSEELTYACNDTAVRLAGDRLTQAAAAAAKTAPMFGPFLLGQLGRCADWPTPGYPLGAVTGKGAPPVLVLGSVDDPETGYPAARAVAGQLSSAVLVSWQSGTHGAYPASACVAAAVDGYLLRRAMPAVGTLCPP